MSEMSKVLFQDEYSVKRRVWLMSEPHPETGEPIEYVLMLIEYVVDGRTYGWRQMVTRGMWEDRPVCETVWEDLLQKVRKAAEDARPK